MAGKDTSATSVATLIAIIALLIVAYLILIPAEERDKLLRIDEPYSSGGDNDGTTNIRAGNVLLEEFPGEVNPYEKDTITHSLTSINLYNKLDSTTQKLASLLKITKNMLSNDKKTLTFALSENAGQALLYMNVVEAKGEITIKLNNNAFYEGKLSIESLPLELPKVYFSENNVLTFEATSPGWNFWDSNEYVLKDVTLITKERTTNKKAVRTFVMDSAEESNVRKAELDYFINCIRDEGGMMRIFLSNNLLFTDVIVCDERQPAIEINPSLLKEGSNIIEFEIDTGDYRIDEIEIKAELGEKTYPRYSFYINDDLMDRIEDHDREIELSMEFEDKNLRKRAAITLNEGQLTLDTKGEAYSIDISAYVEEGTNYIKIIPKTTFDIESLIISVK